MKHISKCLKYSENALVLIKCSQAIMFLGKYYCRLKVFSCDYKSKEIYNVNLNEEVN